MNLMRGLEEEGISSATFEQLFPFFFIVNSTFEIEVLGASLAELLRDYFEIESLPVPFERFFSCVTLEAVDDFNKFSDLAGQLVEFILTPINLSFKGQIILSSSKENAIFCGSPSIKDFSRFKSLGLSTSKFALHDMTISHAVLLEMYKTQMNELNTLNSRLKQSAKEKKRLLADVTFQANFDNLTGLANRRHFCEQLKQKIDVLDGQEIIGMCLLGLDDFKSINDFLGYQSGDHCLIEITGQLKKHCQKQDVIARIGGDEFAILLVGRAEADAVVADIKQLLAEVQQPLTIGHENWVPSASVGVEFIQPDLSVSLLLRHCDDAMREAKSKGKGHIVVYNDKLGERQRQRNFVHSNLDGAIKNGDLRAFFQPIINADTGMAYSVEALARWKKPGGGWIPPFEFIPHIEGSDLSINLGEALIDYSLKSLARLYDRLGKRSLYISINTTARQLYGNSLIYSIQKYCEQYDISPHSVILEITETSLLMDESSVQNILIQLNKLGVKMALDDFGTGFSSLSYLSRFPFDVLKIDRAFIRDIHNNEVNRKLVAAIVNMAKALDLRVVAEGIEKVEELNILGDLGVKYIQGFYYSKPLPIDDLEIFLKG